MRPKAEDSEPPKNVFFQEQLELKVLIPSIFLTNGFGLVSTFLKSIFLRNKINQHINKKRRPTDQLAVQGLKSILGGKSLTGEYLKPSEPEFDAQATQLDLLDLF